jgi:hypothetical protein
MLVVDVSNNIVTSILFMYTTDKFEEIKRAVESLTELPEGWMRRNMMECVDARTLVVAYMLQCHCNRREVCVATGLKKSTVAKLARQYNERIKFDKRFQMLDSWLHLELSEKSTRSVY